MPRQKKQAHEVYETLDGLFHLQMHVFGSGNELYRQRLECINKVVEEEEKYLKTIVKLNGNKEEKHTDTLRPMLYCSLSAFGYQNLSKSTMIWSDLEDIGSVIVNSFKRHDPCCAAYSEVLLEATKNMWSKLQTQLPINNKMIQLGDLQDLMISCYLCRHPEALIEWLIACMSRNWINRIGMVGHSKFDKINASPFNGYSELGNLIMLQELFVLSCEEHNCGRHEYLLNTYSASPDEPRKGLLLGQHMFDQPFMKRMLSALALGRVRKVLGHKLEQIDERSAIQRRSQKYKHGHFDRNLDFVRGNTPNFIRVSNIFTRLVVMLALAKYELNTETSISKRHWERISNYVKQSYDIRIDVEALRKMHRHLKPWFTKQEAQIYSGLSCMKFHEVLRAKSSFENHLQIVEDMAKTSILIGDENKIIEQTLPWYQFQAMDYGRLTLRHPNRYELKKNKQPKA